MRQKLPVRRAVLYVFRGLYLASLLILIVGKDSVALASEVATSDDIFIERERPRFNDQMTYTPSKIRLERPNLDSELRETVGRMPLLTSGSRSGFGSASSVVTVTGLGSASTAVSVDGIPIVDPVGVGFNFSLVPSALVEGVEYWLPHHQALEPRSQTLSAPSGRLNIRTRSSAKSPLGMNVTFGSHDSILGSAVYTSQQTAVALTGFNTKGDYYYKNDLNGSQERRLNNSASGGGGLFRWSKPQQNNERLSVFGLLSGSMRKNPGSLEFPGQSKQEDLFSVVGASASNELHERTHGSATLAGTFSKVAIKTPPRYENRTFGAFAQTALERQFDAVSINLTLDDHIDYVRADSGRRNRNIFGLAVATPLRPTKRLTFAPWIRQEIANRMPSTRDAIAALSYEFAPRTSWSVSYGYLHAYPTISQIAGEHTAFGEILPNDSLKLERSSVWTSAFAHESSKFQFFSLLQHARIRNRISFESVSSAAANRSQYVNTADAFVAAWTNDLQWNPTALIGLRGAATLSRSFDYATRRDLAFKPRVIALASGALDLGEAARLVSRGLVGRPGALFFSVEESVWGKRWIESTGVATVSPIVQTHMRLSYDWAGYGIAFRVANIFEESGFDYPGYPIPGRTYWLTMGWNL